MIGIIQYGMGNIGSMKNAFTFLNIPCVVSGNTNELSECSRLVLPGVGAFQPAMDILSTGGLGIFIQQWAKEGKPLLGICLGMQLLLSQSEENGITQGLGLIPGTVSPLKQSERKVHMGWNEVEPTKNNSLISQKGFAYFVHSYACRPHNDSHVISTTHYGESFPSAIQNQNVMGVQFHPEKSQDYGLNILRRFVGEKI